MSQEPKLPQRTDYLSIVQTGPGNDYAAKIEAFLTHNLEQYAKNQPVWSGVLTRKTGNKYDAIVKAFELIGQGFFDCHRWKERLPPWITGATMAIQIAEQRFLDSQWDQLFKSPPEDSCSWLNQHIYNTARPLAFTIVSKVREPLWLAYLTDHYNDPILVDFDGKPSISNEYNLENQHDNELITKIERAFRLSLDDSSILFPVFEHTRNAWREIGRSCSSSRAASETPEAEEHPLLEPIKPGAMRTIKPATKR